MICTRLTYMSYCNANFKLFLVFKYVYANIPLFLLLRSS